MEDECSCYLRYRHAPAKAVKSCRDSVEAGGQLDKVKLAIRGMLLSFFGRGISKMMDT